MTKRTLFVVCLLVVSTLSVGIAPTTATPETQCSNMVVHDDYRFDNSTIQQAANGSASSTVSNTKVSVEQDTGFIRVKAKNPNGYCNEVHVRLASEVVPVSELGSIDSIDGNHTTSWHAVRDFEREETYTEVTFTLGAGEQATFAPSDIRVRTLSWTGKAKSVSSGLFGNLSKYNPLADDDEPLEQRTYTYSPETNNSTRYITVALVNQSDDRRIEDWQAVYKQPDGEWRPVTEESDNAVFYRKMDGENVQFIFNDRDATVRFTANPTRWEQAQHEWTIYRSGSDFLSNFSFGGVLATSPPPDVSGGARP